MQEDATTKCHDTLSKEEREYLRSWVVVEDTL